jgi:hypothetical protein
MMNDRRFRAGDHVLVRPPEEILSTLDGNGTLDGFPFMPEMLGSCGKVFQVKRRVVKICAPDLPLRRFPADDVVILDGPRCDGSGHDGCKDGCRILWKEAWLRPSGPVATTTEISKTGLEKLRARLKVKSDEHHYFCQSTERFKATEAFPGKQRPWIFRIVFREIRNGDLSAPEVLRLFALWFWQKLLRAANGHRSLCGPRKRTPSASLDLKPGEIVRVKSRAQIVETLDHGRKNRGLGICYEMMRCCGHEAEVRYRVDRMIDEKSRTMRELSDTVALQNIGHREGLAEECHCDDQLGDCPRGGLMYWREIWLERVNRSGA